MYTITELDELFKLYEEDDPKPQLVRKVVVLFKEFLGKKNITEISREDLEKVQKEFLEDYENRDDLVFNIFTYANAMLDTTEWLDTALEIQESDKKYINSKEKYLKQSKFIPIANRPIILKDLFMVYLEKKGITKLTTKELIEEQKAFIREYKKSDDFLYDIISQGISTLGSPEWLDSSIKFIDDGTKMTMDYINNFGDEIFGTKKSKIINPSPVKNTNTPSPFNPDDLSSYTPIGEHNILKYRNFLKL